MTSKQSDGPEVVGKLVKELYFPTQIYFTDLPGADALNKELREQIFSWQAREPDGIIRSNVRGTGAWHSPIDMHTRSEYRHLTRQIYVNTTLAQLHDAMRRFGTTFHDVSHEGDSEPWPLGNNDAPSSGKALII